jgi:FAD/FMN-containing dehydrogenase
MPGARDLDSRLMTSSTFRGRFITSGPELAEFGSASGVLRITPTAVAVPADAADVAALVRWSEECGVPLVPRGAGTGMPGGNVGSGVAVDLVTSFRGIGDVDPERRLVRVEPGVTPAELNAVSLPHGLRFPVDPSSGDRCTLGGMIANDSGGAHSVRYGTTRRWVRSLDLVLADGTPVTVARGEAPRSPRLLEILERVDRVLGPERAEIEAAWPRVRKNSSGYALREYLRTGDAVDLLVGSEGTLALVVGAVLELAPIPAAHGLALLELDSLDAAAHTVPRFLSLEPSTCEMLDRTFLDMVREGGAATPFPLDPRLEAILLVEVEADSEDAVREALAAVQEVARDGAARVSLALDPDLQESFWGIRHAASPIIAARAGDRVSMQFIEDGVVPVERLADYVRLLRDVLGRHHLPAVIFGHAGDGNLHVNPLVDLTASDARSVLDAVLREVADGVARFGGTLAGEHGDGRLRAPLLETIWGPRMVARFRAVKHAFDPLGILNPGVILPLPGQSPFDALP